jgi:outer membrane protein OmpA-like peptidoglycan-associated protein
MNTVPLIIAIVVSLLGSTLELAAQAAPSPGKVLSKDAILQGLKKPVVTRSLVQTRSIGVAAKPEITTNAILFKFGTTEIEGEESFAQIKELGEALEDPTLKNAIVEIQGHTDNVGSDEFNTKLSENRAKKIVEALRRQYNLSVQSLIPIGKGKDEPAEGGGTKERQTDAERALNRRVVVQRVDQ